MRAALIGLGEEARHHVNSFHSHPDSVELVAVVDPDPIRRHFAEQNWGGRAYATPEELFEADPGLDAVWVCVNPYEHGDIEMALIERRIPFFVENPLSADRLTAEAIGRAIADCGLVVGVGYHWRALDRLREVRHRLDAHPPRMVIGEWHDHTLKDVWWQQQSQSGGQFVAQAAHLIDLARVLLGEGELKAAVAARPARIGYPEMDIASVSAALIDFPNNVIGSFSASCVLGNTERVNLQLLCEGMHVTITPHNIRVNDYRNDETYFPQDDPYLNEDRMFMRAVAANDPTYLYCTYADALITHRLCHDIVTLGS